MRFKKGDRVKIEYWKEGCLGDWREDCLGTVTGLTGNKSLVFVKPDSENTVFTFLIDHLELVPPSSKVTRYVWRNDTFEGHYPVGTAALVIAETQERATELLNAELRRKGLPSDVKPEEMVLTLPNEEQVIILNDGEY